MGRALCTCVDRLSAMAELGIDAWAFLYWRLTFWAGVEGHPTLPDTRYVCIAWWFLLLSSHLRSFLD